MPVRRNEIRALFREATRHHRSDRLAEAEAAYREALALAPDHADSLHGLGVLAHQSGRSDLAIAYIGRALQLKSGQAHWHINLGRALRDRGHVEEARAAFHVAVLMTPDDPVAQFDLATALGTLGRREEALGHYRAAVRIDPSFAAAHASLGLALYGCGELREAATSFRALVRLAPENPDWGNLLGATLIDLGRAEAAEEPLRNAVRMAPDHVDAHNNLGLALQAAGRLDEALGELETALRLQPDNPDIASNRATALRDLGRDADAEEIWRQVLAQHPEHASAQFNLATMKLAAGDFAGGWTGFEYRLRVPGRRARDFTQPPWNGEALDGVVLIHAEQGFGDTIQFCRYVTLAARLTRIVLEVPRPLVRLMAGLQGVGEIVARGDPLPHFDRHCPMLSLPGLFGTTAQTIPTEVPYLRVAEDPAWTARLGELVGLRIGLCWAGSRAYSHDRLRSVAAADLIAAAGGPGVSLVSLQTDEPGLRGLHQFMGDVRDFADTAALVAGLDLVISVDTAVAHLAGALGKDVWLLNRFDPDWRWKQGAWYPTLREFRQLARGEWDGVMRDVRKARGLCPLHPRQEPAAPGPAFLRRLPPVDR